MHSRSFLLSCCLLLACATAPAATLNEQRHYYDEARQALEKGNRGPWQQHAQALQDYPLTPYLAYTELTARLNTAPDSEIEAFIRQHGDLPQIRWMKLRWLRRLAASGAWPLFARYYSPALKFTELDCLQGRYLIQSGQPEAGHAVAEHLWLSGKSQPDSCEPLFARWASAGLLTQELIWQRARLAAGRNNTSLATRLVSQLQGSLQRPGALLLEITRKPALISQPERFLPAREAMADVVGLGLRQLARKNPEQALALLEDYARRLHFSGREKVALAQQIGLRLARRFDSRALAVMERYDPGLQNDSLSEWHARLLLRLGRWDEAHALIRRFPESLASSSRWRYWKARSFELAHPENRQATPLYQPVAKERDFYGFLSADRIQAPYQLNHQPLPLNAPLLQKVRQAPGIQRALEFYARGQIADARREWYHASQFFSQEEMVAQARMAYDMGWYFPAIRTISQARYWDDLEVRFPMAHQEHLLGAARQRDIHPSWAFAITRQESGFMADARSSVGASGLMQLMPATARETARRFGIPLASSQQILNPATNIQLGTAYLSQIYNQFNGNRVLASAAYNAGPGRVRQWLKDARHLSFDVWIENIPFDETRQYVQNVLTYAVIYGQKLNDPRPLVEWHERFFENQ